jgi:hypothetical protein
MLYSLQIMELLLLDPTAGRSWARHFTACGGYERLCSCLLLRSTTTSSSDGSSVSCSSMSPLQRQCLALVLRLVRAFEQNSDAISSSGSSGSSGAAGQQEDQLLSDAGKAIDST